MPEKVPIRKSKTVTVVYFGSDDLADMPSDLDYKIMQTRLSEIRPEDIRALPSTIAGNKLIRLEAHTAVVADGEKWGFKGLRSRRVVGAIEENPFVMRATEQLHSALSTGNPRFVLVPYFARLEKLP